MSMLCDLVQAFEEGKKQFEEIMESQECCGFKIDEIYNIASEIYSEAIPPNRVVWADNLEYMEYLLKERKMKGEIQLIYMDPPFFSNGKYQASIKIESENMGNSPLIKTGAYDDHWKNDMKVYLRMLTVRLFMMRELLADTGSIWVHLDWHAAHPVKLLLDQIFGEKNFINEVIWTYKSGGANKRSFARKHDTLLFYAKSDKYVFNLQREKSYNRGMNPYRFKGVEEYQDNIGWYTMVNMKDVWNIDMVGRTSGERTGYATQKPEKLIERIVKTCSNEGDICADFFAGSGTLGAVCSKWGRSWIMCDSGNIAVANQIYRLAEDGRDFAVERKHPQKEVDDGGKHDDILSIHRINAEGAGDVLELTGYKTDITKLCCDSKKTIRKYFENDSFSLVKFWGLAVLCTKEKHNDKENFCCDFFIIDEIFDSHIRKMQIKNNIKSSNMYIIGYNVFGSRFAVKI